MMMTLGSLRAAPMPHCRALRSFARLDHPISRALPELERARSEEMPPRATHARTRTRPRSLTHTIIAPNARPIRRSAVGTRMPRAPEARAIMHAGPIGSNVRIGRHGGAAAERWTAASTKAWGGSTGERGHCRGRAEETDG